MGRVHAAIPWSSVRGLPRRVRWSARGGTPSQHQAAGVSAMGAGGLRSFSGWLPSTKVRALPRRGSIRPSVDAKQWARPSRTLASAWSSWSPSTTTGFAFGRRPYTAYSVKASPWKGGQGIWSRNSRMRRASAGLRVGLYLSPWDESFPSTSAEYERYLRDQLTELLSNYGPSPRSSSPAIMRQPRSTGQASRSWPTRCSPKRWSGWAPRSPPRGSTSR